MGMNNKIFQSNNTLLYL